MRSLFISLSASILMLFIQSTWLSHGIVFGIIPDLAMSIVVFSSFINKDGQGIIVAFIAGLIADMLSAAPLGYYAFLYVSCAYLATLLSYVAEKDIFIIPFLLGTGAAIARGILTRFVSWIFAANINTYQIFSAEFGIELLADGFFTVLVFFILTFFQPLLENSPRKALP